MSGSEEEDQLIISVQRQYGLHTSNLFDYIIFTVNISTPIIEKDSLGLIKYMFPTVKIILEDNSILKIDTTSHLRIREYMKAPGYNDREYHSGGLNLYPILASQQTESFQTILTQNELKQLLRHKLRYVQLNDKIIPVPKRLSHNVAKQIECIVGTKSYLPVPKHN